MISYPIIPLPASIPSRLNHAKAHSEAPPTCELQLHVPSSLFNDNQHPPLITTHFWLPAATDAVQQARDQHAYQSYYLCSSATRLVFTNLFIIAKNKTSTLNITYSITLASVASACPYSSVTSVPSPSSHPVN
ncbi:hypothetical protein JD969_08045 [Planctomycetota bacterium]|nr:hypothetical protein JD969_08045 [Planctomycetota bacterium]